MSEKKRALAFAVLLEHLESEGMHMARSIVEDEYSFRFGDNAMSTLRATMETELPQVCPHENRNKGKMISALDRLLRAQMAAPVHVRGEEEAASGTKIAHNHLDANEQSLPSSSVQMITPLVTSSSVPGHVKTMSRSRTRRRRRSSLAMSSTPSTIAEPHHLESNPIPDYSALDKIEDLVIDRNGAVEGGSPMALLRWACRCAWLSASHSTDGVSDPSQSQMCARYCSDLMTFLVTFTDFMTPEAVVETLETIILEHPKESWGLQQFLLQWLEYDFYQVRRLRKPLPFLNRSPLVFLTHRLFPTCHAK